MAGEIHPPIRYFALWSDYGQRRLTEALELFDVPDDLPTIHHHAEILVLYTRQLRMENEALRKAIAAPADPAPAPPEPEPPKPEYWYPSVGDIWHWQPLLSHATQRIKVTKVTWNGEEWIIETIPANKLGWHHDQPSWHDLGEFVQSSVLVEPASA